MHLDFSNTFLAATVFGWGKVGMHFSKYIELKAESKHFEIK